MIYLPDELIDRLIREDAPSLDLTTWTLGLRDEPGLIRFSSREEIVVCGTEEVRRIFARLGAEVTEAVASGTHVSPGGVILEGRGGAAALHLAWKVSLNVLENGSGIATRAHRLVANAKAVNPSIEVVTTRKNFPGTKELAIKAVVAGGALPHRLGLSETILAFEQHRVFCGGFDGFVARIPDWRKRVCEKKIVVEVASLAEAQTVARSGVDGVQFDKVQPDELRLWVTALKQEFPRLNLIAAGGVNENNAAAYAATGVDALATSSIYFGKPADIRAEMSHVLR
jgi:molybdenum transport protein